MLLVVRVLGLELLSIEASTEDEDDLERDLSGGALGSTLVGFSRTEQISEDDGVER